MTTSVLEELMVKTESLPNRDKVRLAIHLLQQSRPSSNRPRKKWADLAGIAPGLLDEDAQEWVSRSRREDTEHREALLRR